MGKDVDPWSAPKTAPRSEGIVPARTKMSREAAEMEAEEREENAVRKAAVLECRGCRFVGPKLEKHRNFRWYTFLLIPAFVILGGGVFGLVLVILWAGSTTAACAQCGATKGLGPSGSAVSEEARAIWRASHARDRRGYVTAQLVALATVLLGGAALVVLLNQP